MKTIKLLFYIGLLFYAPSLYAQQQQQQSIIDTISKVTQSYTSYDEMRQKLLLTQIPPLDTLFASARINNARILLSEMETEIAIREMKTEQNQWLSHFSAFATYQYGVMASLVDISQGGTPVNPQYAQQAQNWWNVGISFNVSFSEFFDRTNKVKRRDAQVRLAQYNTEVKFDELKTEIAESYSAAILSLTLSQAMYDRYNIAKANYEVLESQFFTGRISSTELSDAKAKEVEAYVLLQVQLSELIHHASRLETLSKMTIINY